MTCTLSGSTFPSNQPLTAISFLSPKTKSVALPPVTPAPAPVKASALEVQDAKDATIRKQANRQGYQSTLLSQPLLGAPTAERKSILG